MFCCCLFLEFVTNYIFKFTLYFVAIVAVDILCFVVVFVLHATCSGKCVKYNRFVAAVYVIVLLSIVDNDDDMLCFRVDLKFKLVCPFLGGVCRRKGKGI